MGEDPVLVSVIIHLQESKVHTLPSVPGKKAPAPKIIKESLQKAFEFDFEGPDSSVYHFWCCAIHALGLHFDGPYKAVCGQNMIFKWRFDGQV
jgi:hypothetical protein